MNAMLNEELIEQSLAGDRKAADALVTSCLPHVWRTVVLCCGNRSESEDLVQISLVRMLEKLPSYRGEGKFAAWLDRLTVNVVKGHFRRAKFWDVLVSSGRLEDPSYEEESPDRRAEGRRLLNRLARHLSGVKERNRIALALSITRDYSVAEIAAAVGCSSEAAKKRLQRGRLELVRRLEKDPYCEQLIEEYIR